MEDFFIIPHSRIEKEWRYPDMSLDFFALEYCEEVLDIPLFCIEDADYVDEGLEIQLKPSQNQMHGEDWYINLVRLSVYMRAS